LSYFDWMSFINDLIVARIETYELELSPSQLAVFVLALYFLL